MATTLLIRFPLGRYHATPWAEHVNTDNNVELPPSLWRLLRALYAVWKTRVPDLDESVVRDLLTRLAEPPTYFVPPYQVGHTRHWYPDSQHRTGKPSTDKTLDTWAVFDPDAELAIRWSDDLPTELHKALDRLADSLPYLGRADSICEARLDNTWEATPGHTSWRHDSLGLEPATASSIRLLAPENPLDLDALIMRPVELRTKQAVPGESRLYPPHTRFLDYQPIQPSALDSGPRDRTSVSGETVQVVRYTITDRVLPPIQHAVRYTDLLRSAVVGKLNWLRENEQRHTLLAGRDDHNVKLTGHQHAHYLAIPEQHHKIRELIIWAPGGLDHEELHAATQIQQLYGNVGSNTTIKKPVRVAAYGRAEHVLCDLATPATTWTSLTPFIPPRHPKKTWEEFLRNEIEREHTARGLTPPIAVEPADTNTDWRSFINQRPTKNNRSRRRNLPSPGTFLTLHYETPTRGPLALGYLSHFGLGLFQPHIT